LIKDKLYLIKAKLPLIAADSFMTFSVITLPGSV
jgi:hypothetical protein